MTRRRVLFALLSTAALIALPWRAVAGLAGDADHPLDCAPSYQPGLDYFGTNKLNAAAGADLPAGLAIEYRGNYKFVNVSATGELLALWQCGTQPPRVPQDVPAGTKLVQVPVARLALQNAAAAGAVQALRAYDRVAYVPANGATPACLQNVSTPAGGPVALWSAAGAAPDPSTYDVVLTDKAIAADPKSIYYPAAALDVEPLERSRWLSLVAVLFNLDSRASSVLASMRSAYACRVGQLAKVPTPRPRVAWVESVPGSGLSLDGSGAAPASWRINVGRYARTLVLDAGGDILAPGSPQGAGGLGGPGGPQGRPGGPGGAGMTVANDQLLDAVALADVVVDATDRTASGRDMAIGEWLAQFGETMAQVSQFPFVKHRQLYALDALKRIDGVSDYPQTGTQLAPFVLQDLMSVMYGPAQPTYRMRYLRNMAYGDGFSRVTPAQCPVALVATLPNGTAAVTPAPTPLFDRAEWSAVIGPSSPERVVPANAADCPVADYTRGTSLTVASVDGGAPAAGPGIGGAGVGAGAIAGIVVGVVAFAGFAVFGAPKAVSAYRKRKMGGYVREMS